ncbi:ribokinase [Acidisoma silvae]|uniref:Ribokinase n=1 Tax=Acidisoma silvae TaxID=2802396 RepID=A0A964DY59_9PROT|nr:ribokinase [Acidisoma silvae]MCB8874413.1 ribokinase [Acidisoma silvae]
MIIVMGVFAVDFVFQTPDIPVWTKTQIGSGFSIGPGGKGSNQAIATARLGAPVEFIAKIGTDHYGAMARGIYQTEGVGTRFLQQSADLPTGSAAIIVHAETRENAIIIVPGAAATLTTGEIAQAADEIGKADAFITQLETPLPLVTHALTIARRAGVRTILNPAPVPEGPVSDELWDIIRLSDILTPNEKEASELTGLPVTNAAEAEAAADALIARGAGAVIITLGEKGALLRHNGETVMVPAVRAGAVVDTTGAGDSFNAGIAVALSEGLALPEALRFACAVAGLKVTRAGAGAGMPKRAEVDALLAQG